jgi:nitrous oxidase accessory protein NosD
MEENYVHSNQDSGVTVHETGTSAVIKRNYMQRNGWGGVRVYSGACADVQVENVRAREGGREGEEEVLVHDAHVRFRELRVQRLRVQGAELPEVEGCWTPTSTYRDGR